MGRRPPGCGLTALLEEHKCGITDACRSARCIRRTHLVRRRKCGMNGCCGSARGATRGESGSP
eukprot:1602820-Alexandrium_andersonii.AAC.1